MVTASTNLESDLRISPEPVLIALPILGLAFYLMSGISAEPEGLEYAGLVLLHYALAGAAWLLLRFDERAGRWFLVVILEALVHAVSLWTGFPGALNLAAFAVGLAAAMISLWRPRRASCSPAC